MRKFSTMPIIGCSPNNVCNFASRNDYSYWLATEAKLPEMMTPIEAPDVKQYISR
jgi:integrin beta 8